MSGVAAFPGWQAGICILIPHLEDPASGALRSGDSEGYGILFLSNPAGFGE